MSGVLLFFARLLGRLGFGRNFFHVEAGAQVHITMQVTAGGTGAPLEAAELFIEKPPLSRTGGPTLLFVGRTDASGRLSETVVVHWSYEVPDLSRTLPPPQMSVVVRKANHRDSSAVLDIASLPLVSAIRQLDLGTIALDVI